MVPLGLWLRFKAPIAEAIRDASGSATYVVFWTLLAAFLWPRAKPFRLTMQVLLATCCIEFLQQWHPAWLERIRATLPGRLVLGTTFDWSDFPPYFCGGMLAWATLRLVGYITRKQYS
jgi:Protein of unknown function (DUF2809)